MHFKTHPVLFSVRFVPVLSIITDRHFNKQSQLLFIFHQDPWFLKIHVSFIRYIIKSALFSKYTLPNNEK